MAKILVADDNSNIQKMVGLALKDHGIEVVAVGNGEAAVRKISDVRPDLVLADVFMPVRNGYEVCKYVKDDKALSHIPVILLVGAFDPLDEQEAQRSGADGVLKKPFVPPDPLISMVKSALVRAGVPHAGFNPAKAEPEPAPAPVAAAPPPRPPAPVFEEPKPFVPEEMESFVDEVPARPAALKIESGEQPVAFGSLLDTAGTSTEEDAPELAPAPANLRMERDWGSTKEEEEDEEEEAPKSFWRRDAGDEEPSSVDEGVGTGSRSFRSSHHAPWTPTHEKSDLTDTVESVESGPAGMMDRRDMPSTAPFSGEAWAAAIDAGADRNTVIVEEEHPTAPAATALDGMPGGHVAEPMVADTPAFAAPVVSPIVESSVAQAEVVEEVSEPERVATTSDNPAMVIEMTPAGVTENSTLFVGEESTNTAEQQTQVPEPGFATSEFVRQAPTGSIDEPPASTVEEQTTAVVAEETPVVAESPKRSTADSWFSTAPNPWEAEAQKASQLASTWDTTVSAPRGDHERRPAAPFEPTSVPDEIEVVSGVNSEIGAAMETVREEASHAVEQVEQQVEASRASAETKGAVHDAAAHLDLDAVVAKVLARLSPDLLQEAARDILRPVVEAVIREELNAKKL